MMEWDDEICVGGRNDLIKNRDESWGGIERLNECPF
jgi:hypothetical protein